MDNVKELFVTYKLDSGDGKFITAEINNEMGTITIKTFQGQTDFKFINSKPDMVRAVAKLMIQAASLIAE